MFQAGQRTMEQETEQEITTSKQNQVTSCHTKAFHQYVLFMHHWMQSSLYHSGQGGNEYNLHL